MQRTSFAIALLTAHALAWNGKPDPRTRIPLRPQTLQKSGHGSLLNKDICHRAVDRLLYKNIDFNDVLRDNTHAWTDANFAFPTPLFWEDMRVASEDDQSSLADPAKWRRISEVFADGDYSLWGSKGIEYGDPNQGYLGDCWIHAASAVVANDPERIKKLFEIEQLNKAGVYAVQMYVMGIPVTVTVDDYLLF